MSHWDVFFLVIEKEKQEKTNLLHFFKGDRLTEFALDKVIQL